ncbi:peptide-N(4)-(N-acetyl-beta-glucosaminyl)asparagine amidase isoform X2 [Zootermopsis nevadensis]|uniref:peptide-N(4)-(N-acetyl-beta- glucosaminyl)asparagine amidase isoform X2 n=1 Tax=Zootermopsis nevadensis TaxID=136037 RepID=UPI000B8E6D55|nr:peptide-N(4)-(N-acetyl-beta-glucosaminyl)asparagine amidase isoform X2 [Zootermopsis nevadensis]
MISERHLTMKTQLMQKGHKGEDSLVLPDSISLENLRRIRDEISTRRNNYKTMPATSAASSEPPKKDASCKSPSSTISTSVPYHTEQKQLLTHQKPFLQRVTSHFRAVLRYEDKELQSKALEFIPLKDFELAAENNMRNLQRAIKSGCTNEQEVDIQEFILMELLSWFKNSFFSWVDSPECTLCKGTTKFAGHSSNSVTAGEAYRIEVYSCNTCQEKTLFPRYNDPEKLLETRKGRCGEWANCFTLMCRALGWETRYIADETDHVWTEVYSGTQKRWMHCDPCENVFDTPLMYEIGWGKKLSYVMAYSRDEVQDVTWRYSCRHNELLSRRNECTEKELLDAIIQLRQERQQDMSTSRKLYLNKRLLAELVEFMTPRQPTEGERKGRSSGSLAWRLARGETDVAPKCINPFVWKPTQSELKAGQMHIQYSTSRNKYVRSVGMEELEGWENGTFHVKYVFRKEEKDWKMTYLSRTKDSDEGIVTWKFDLTDSGVVVDSVRIQCSTWLRDTGRVLLKMCALEMCTLVPGDSKVFETTDFQGCSQLEFTAQLRGGTGECAWQHAQLFRQNINDKDYPLDVIIRLKKQP